MSAAEEKAIKAEWETNLLPKNPVDDPDWFEAIKILGRSLTGQDHADFETAMNRK